MNEIRIGRALQLEGLQHARNKVTLGFKCEAGTKIQLAQEAQEHGMTLSEYVDTVISMRHNQRQPSNTAMQHSELSRKLHQQSEQILQLERKVGIYENNFLKQAYAKHKGQTLTYKDAKCQERSITISRIEDVFTVMFNSFTF